MTLTFESVQDVRKEQSQKSETLLIPRGENTVALFLSSFFPSRGGPVGIFMKEMDVFDEINQYGNCCC